MKKLIIVLVMFLFSCESNFVKEIFVVTYKEIDKSLPKPKVTKTYTLELTKEKEQLLNSFLTNNKITIISNA